MVRVLEFAQQNHGLVAILAVLLVMIAAFLFIMGLKEERVQTGNGPARKSPFLPLDTDTEIYQKPGIARRAAKRLSKRAILRQARKRRRRLVDYNWRIQSARLRRCRKQS